MDRQEERATGSGLLSQDQGELTCLAQVETIVRLVNEQHRLRGEEADGQQEALTLPLGQGAYRHIEETFEGEIADDLAASRAGTAEEPDREIERPSNGLRRPRSDA